MISSAIDNDVLIKSASYRLLQSVVALDVFGSGAKGVLGAAPFLVRKRLAKRPPACGAAAAIEDFEAALPNMQLLEPTEEESRVAADMEYEAQRRGLALDPGESVLATIVVARALSCLATGDKRAISALGALSPEVVRVQALEGKVICFEQIIVRLLTALAASSVKSAICQERDVDRALSICFSCSSSEIPVEECHAALGSYIESLRTDSNGLLMPN